jgi:RES domain-containing protein
VVTGARFTPLGGFKSIYLASDPITALHEVRALFGETTVLTPPWTVFAVRGAVHRVLDLTDVDVQKRLGTNLEELTGRWLVMQERHKKGKGDLPPTQLLGKVAYEMGTIFAIRYCSAENTGAGVNLAVFADRLTPGGPNFLNVFDPSGLLRQELP